MKIDILSLLKEHEISHPSRVISIKISTPNELHIKLRGFPWWTKTSNTEIQSDITFVFEDVSYGYLNLEISDLDYDEVLEGFCIRKADNCDWAQPKIYEIYCSSPIPDPMEIFTQVYD